VLIPGGPYHLAFDRFSERVRYELDPEYPRTDGLSSLVNPHCPRWKYGCSFDDGEPRSEAASS